MMSGCPGVANLASNYECPNAFSVRDTTFFVSRNFQKPQITKYFTTFEIPNPVFGCCQNIFEDCESCLQKGLLKSL